MKKLALVILTTLLLGAAIAAQQGAGQPSPGQFTSISQTLQNPPTQVSGVSVSLVGNPGPATLYFWIVSNFTIGNSFPAGPFVLNSAPNALTVSNYAVLTWLPSPGAISYDILLTTTPAAPTGTCNCALVIGTQGSPTSITSTTLQNYSVMSTDPNDYTITSAIFQSAPGVAAMQFSTVSQVLARLDTTGNFTALSFTSTPTTVSGLTALQSGGPGTIAVVTDGQNGADCSSGGGNALVLCVYQGQNQWIASGGSGGSGSGTVNNGNQYQSVVYANNGTAVSPDPNVSSTLTQWNSSHSFGVHATGGFFSDAVTPGQLNLGANGQTFGLAAPAGLASTYTWAVPVSDAAGPVRSSGSGQLTIGLVPGDVTTAVNAQAGASYTVQASDQFKLIALTNAGDVSVTLPADTTTGFGSDWSTTFEYEGAGTVTITPQTSTLCGGASATLTHAQSLQIFGDGTNYRCAPGQGSGSVNIPGTNGQVLLSNGSGGVNAAAGFTYSSGNLTLGNASAGIFSTYQINSNQACTHSGAAFMNMCRGDSVAWNAWAGGANYDQLGIGSDDRLHYTSAVPINGNTANTLAFITDLGSLVAKNTANTYTGGGLQDFSAMALKLPILNGLTETVDGQIGYDSTNNNYHVGVSSSDSLIATFPATLNPSNGNCATFALTGSKIQLGAINCPTGGNMTGSGAAATGDALAANNTGGTLNTAYDPGTINYASAHSMFGTSGTTGLEFGSAPDQTVAGTTFLSDFNLHGTNVGVSSSGTGNVGGPAIFGGGDCKYPLTSSNQCQGGFLALLPGRNLGTTNASLNNPIPGYGGQFTAWRKGNSGNLTTANNGRLLCADGTDLQGNANHNTADICGNVVGDYAAPVGFFKFSDGTTTAPSVLDFINPVGEAVLAQVSGSISGVQSFSAEQWTINAPVCSDPSHPGYVTGVAGHCFCPARRVGTNRLADASPLTLHSIDINMGEACEQQTQVNGTNLTAPSPLNLVAGAGISITNLSLGNVQIAATGGGGSYAWSEVAKTTNYTITATDFASSPPTWFFTGVGTVTYTLPGAGNLPVANSCVRVSNITNSSTVSINSNGIALNGLTGTVTLGNGDSVEVCFDLANSNYKMLGVSSNLSLPNGVTAVTQSTADTSTDVATDQFVHNVLATAGGSYAWQEVPKTSNYSVTASDFASAPPTWFFTGVGAVTYTLPGTGSLPAANSCIRISNLTTSSTISINPNGIQLNGITTTVTLGNGNSVEICFDATLSNYKMLGVSSDLALANGVSAVTQTTGDTTTDVATDAFVSNTVNAAINGTTGTVPIYTSAHALGNSPISDDGTTTTFSHPVAIGGSNGQGKLTEGAAPTGGAGFDWMWADAAAHRLKMNNNNAGADTIVGAATTDTLTNKSIDGSEINSGKVNLAFGGTNTDLSAAGSSSCNSTGLALLKQNALHVISSACLGAADVPASLPSTNTVNGTAIPSNGTLTQTIASGTATLGTSAIASGACATVVTVTATGAATTDNISADFNADPTGLTGYGVSSSGAVLTVYKYPTANAVNFKVCNSTASSITPSAATLNWRVTR